jgi:putative ABC transport system substrate-binding protein
MQRREFIILLGSAAAAWPLAARAQEPGKVWRIGMLESISAAMNAANYDALRQGLRELGYVEGQNLVIEYRSADGRTERFPGLAAELIRVNVDLIVTRGTPAVQAAKNATATIPVVMAANGEPLRVVASLARPGGNVTGLSAFTTELETKRLEMIREIVPAARRFAVLYNMANPVYLPRWKELEKTAQSLGIEVQLLDVRKPENLESAFAVATRQRADAILVAIDGLILANLKFIVELVAKHRLPSICSSREFVDSGGLISYGVSYPDLYRRAATYVDKILKGAKPADLPVEQPTKFELIINLKTAKALGITVPPTILTRADEVIE